MADLECPCRADSWHGPDDHCTLCADTGRPRCEARLDHGAEVDAVAVEPDGRGGHIYVCADCRFPEEPTATTFLTAVMVDYLASQCSGEVVS